MDSETVCAWSCCAYTARVTILSLSVKTALTVSQLDHSTTGIENLQANDIVLVASYALDHLTEMAPSQ